jgi:hypothetical protein
MSQSTSFLERSREGSRLNEGNRRVCAFLKRWKVDREDKISPVNLVLIGGGKWNVPKHVMMRFYQSLLVELAGRDIPFSLVEKPHPQGKLVFDFDSEQTILHPEQIAPIIAESVHMVFGEPDEPWPSVFVSVSTSKPKHKIHFIVPVIVCTMNTRRLLYALTWEQLVKRGLNEIADCMDFKMISLRMRYAYKMDPKTREYVLEKGRYERFVLVYPDPNEEVGYFKQTQMLPLFHFSALSFDEPCTEITERGQDVLEKIRTNCTIGPLRRLEWSNSLVSVKKRKVTEQSQNEEENDSDEWWKSGSTSTPLNRSQFLNEPVQITDQQRKELVEHASQSNVLSSFLEEGVYKFASQWEHGGYMIKLLRRMTARCPLDDSTTRRHHDSQNAYMFVNATGTRCWLGCYCKEQKCKLLWESEDAETEQEEEDEQDWEDQEMDEIEPEQQWERSADGKGWVQLGEGGTVTASPSTVQDKIHEELNPPKRPSPKRQSRSPPSTSTRPSQKISINHDKERRGLDKFIQEQGRKQKLKDMTPIERYEHERGILGLH